MEKQSREHQEGPHHHRKQQQQQQVVVVHSRVRRIKEEEDVRAKVHETYQHHVSEMRRVLRDLDRQRSRSPLGRTAISIGGDSGRGGEGVRRSSSRPRSSLVRVD